MKQISRQVALVAGNLPRFVVLFPADVEPIFPATFWAGMVLPVADAIRNVSVSTDDFSSSSLRCRFYVFCVCVFLGIVRVL